MSKEDAQRILDKLKKYTEKTTSTKERARQALMDAGLVQENGQPTDLYKN